MSGKCLIIPEKFFYEFLDNRNLITTTLEVDIERRKKALKMIQDKRLDQKDKRLKAGLINEEEALYWKKRIEQGKKSNNVIENYKKFRGI